MAPAPEGPEEVYRKFERLNRRGGARSLRELVGGSDKKMLYGTFVVVEVAAIVLGVFLKVPYLDTVAVALPGLLVLLHGGLKSENEDGSGDEPTEETLPEKLLRRFGDPDAPGEAPADG